MLKTPRFVFFDVGNVILQYSHELSRDQIAATAGIDAPLVQELVFDSGLQNRYESGEITCETFAAEVLKHSVTDASTDDIISAASDIFKLNREIVPLLTALRIVNVPLGILSNTCPGHWERVLMTAPCIRQYFCKFVLSHESKCMKPGLGIYRDAIRSAQQPAGFIFFIDDRLENVRAARAAGMDAHLYESASQLFERLDERKLRMNY
ncbi:MAG: HAD family phosphatase [Mariniblastus sp.]|nr:HAD family phosphatase [Mariniblastus sp.]